MTPTVGVGVIPIVGVGVMPTVGVGVIPTVGVGVMPTVGVAGFAWSVAAWAEKAGTRSHKDANKQNRPQSSKHMIREDFFCNTISP